MACILAVIPTIPLWGVLAILALLVPAVSAALAVFMKRWVVWLAVISAASTLGLGIAWSEGYLSAAGLSASRVYWGGMAAVGALASAWSVRRGRRLASMPSSRFSRWMAWGLAVAGVMALLGGSYVWTGYRVGGLFWQLLVVIAAMLSGGTIYLVSRRVSPKFTSRSMPNPDTPLLWGLVAGALLVLLIPQQEPSAPNDSPRVVWSFEPIERGAIISSPLLVEDKLFVATIRDSGLGSSGVVYCLNAPTGKERWRFDDGGSMLHVYSSPCLANGLLYVGEGMHSNLVSKLYCLDADTGHKRWDFQTTGHVESSPCVVAGKVYFGAGDDGIHCLDAATGTSLWHFHGPFHVDVNPTVSGGRLYAGSGISKLNQRKEAFCLDAETGRVLWRTPTRLPVWGSPLVDHELVYFGMGTGRLERNADPGEKPDGGLLCVEASTGTLKWEYAVTEGVFGRPIADEDRVYFGSRNGWCYALDRRSGDIRWQVDLASPCIANPVLVGNAVYQVTGGGSLCCLDAMTGRLLWAFDVGAYSQTKPRAYSTPIVSELVIDNVLRRRIYVGMELRNPISSAAVLYCFEE